MKITPNNLDLFNSSLRYESPTEIIAFALEQGVNPMVSTSFGPYSASLLHAATSVDSNIRVVWCDTGYNTTATYKHADRLINDLQLNISIFTPHFTKGFLDSTMGEPAIDNPRHEEFSEKVKWEPFHRAIATFRPDVWLTNIRNGQTDHRDTLDILSFSQEGILKVSPFYHYSDDKLRNYLSKHQLPTEHDYFDPVKALENRECGIHLRN